MQCCVLKTKYLKTDDHFNASFIVEDNYIKLSSCHVALRVNHCPISGPYHTHLIRVIDNIVDLLCVTF